MENLPFGMTKTPILWNVDVNAFMSFLDYSVKDDSVLAEYKRSTGNDMKSLVNCSVLSQMIDSETGHGKAMFRDFADWLVVNHWGEETEADTQAKAMVVHA